MYSVVTDTDDTSKDILKKGQLQQQTTFLPMNKIRGREIHPSIVKTAQNLVGKENVAPALSLINYAPEYDVIMKYVFGRTFVCKDIDTAKKVGMFVVVVLMSFSISYAVGHLPSEHNDSISHAGR